MISIEKAAIAISRGQVLSCASSQMFWDVSA
jgi:hypothetical protein